MPDEASRLLVEKSHQSLIKVSLKSHQSLTLSLFLHNHPSQALCPRLGHAMPAARTRDARGLSTGCPRLGHNERQKSGFAAIGVQ